MELTTYTIRTTFVGEDYQELCRSLRNYFLHQSIERRGNNLTIRIQLEYWYYHISEYFDEKKDDGIIGDWTREPAS